MPCINDMLDSRDSPDSSQFEFGLALARVAIVAVCSGWMHVGLLATHLGLPQDDAASPSNSDLTTVRLNIHVHVGT